MAIVTGENLREIRVFKVFSAPTITASLILIVSVSLAAILKHQFKNMVKIVDDLASKLYCKFYTSIFYKSL